MQERVTPTKPRRSDCWRSSPVRTSSCEGDHWRLVRGVAKDRVISVVDPDSRHMHKSRSEYRDGYKAHVAVEPETGLITATTLTPASAPDGPTGVRLLENEVPGRQVFADSAYGSGETLAALSAAGHALAIKPFPTHPGMPAGFDRDDFVVDETAGTVTCPAGHAVAITPGRNALFGNRCGHCPLRSRCTNSEGGRKFALTVHDARLVESRRAWRDGDFKEDYRRFRPMVERSLAWLVADNHRRARFRGVEKNQLGSHSVSPLSICDDSSTWASPATELGRSPLPSRRKSRPAKKGPLHELSPPEWSTSTLFASTLRFSHNPDLRTSTYASNARYSTGS